MWVDDLGKRIPRRIEKRKTIADKPIPDMLVHAALLVTMAAILGLWSLWAIRSNVRHQIPMWAPWPLITIVWGILAFDAWRRRSARVQIPKRLKRGECPGCLYDLTGLHDEHIKTIERAIRCPECGAVWRAQRIGSMRKETRA